MSETFNGLLSVKPGNEPEAGEIRTFVIEKRTSRAGKPWLKIKNAGPDYGGTPYRILTAEKTDFVDAHGNLSFNVEIEEIAESREQRLDEMKAKGEHFLEPLDHQTPIKTLKHPTQAPQAPPARQNGKSMEEYAAYATKLFGASWIEAGKWIETAFPSKDAEEMSVRDFYDFKLRVAMHNAIETGRIIRKERF